MNRGLWTVVNGTVEHIMDRKSWAADCGLLREATTGKDREEALWKRGLSPLLTSHPTAPTPPVTSLESSTTRGPTGTQRKTVHRCGKAPKEKKQGTTDERKAGSAGTSERHPRQPKMARAKPRTGRVKRATMPEGARGGE